MSADIHHTWSSVEDLEDETVGRKYPMYYGNYIFHFKGSTTPTLACYVDFAAALILDPAHLIVATSLRLLVLAVMLGVRSWDISENINVIILFCRARPRNDTGRSW